MAIIWTFKWGGIQGDINLQPDLMAAIAAAAATAAWGTITGILADQPDLQAALNLKANQTDLNTTNAAVATKANQADLNTTNTTVASLTVTVALKATTTYVDAQDAALATAIGLKAATTYVDAQDAALTTAIGVKANTASPTFTGTVTAPTLNVTTTLQIGGGTVTATAAEINKLAGVAGGTATANKALVLGATKNVDTIVVTGLADTGSFRATAQVAPSAGTGVEFQYVPASLAGFLQVYDRDAGAYRGLVLDGNQIILGRYASCPVLIGRASGLTGAGDLDVKGNFRAHNSAAAGTQSADAGSLTGASAGWETNAQTRINAIRDCLRNHALMA